MTRRYRSQPGNRKFIGISAYADIAPELALIYATLERAILDAAGILASGSTSHKSSAIAWILNESVDDFNREFSFPWCCEHLNVDIKTTRKRIVSFVANRKGKWGGRTEWQTIAHMIADEVPSSGDYDVYCESDELLKDDS